MIGLSRRVCVFAYMRPVDMCKQYDWLYAFRGRLGAKTPEWSRTDHSAIIHEGLLSTAPQSTCKKTLRYCAKESCHPHNSRRG